MKRTHKAVIAGLLLLIFLSISKNDAERIAAGKLQEPEHAAELADQQPVPMPETEKTALETVPDETKKSGIPDDPVIFNDGGEENENVQPAMQARSMAMEIASAILEEMPDGSDLEKASLAASVLYQAYIDADPKTITENGDAYTFLCEGIPSKQGAADALTMILQCSGISAQNIVLDEKIMTTCTLDGKKAYADAMTGSAWYIDE